MVMKIFCRVQRDLLIEARWIKGFDHHEDAIDNKRWAKQSEASIRIVQLLFQTYFIHLGFKVKNS